MRRLLCTIVLTALVMSSSYGQSTGNVPVTSPQLNFVPLTFEDQPQQSLQIQYKPLPNTRSTSLIVTGYFLSGLKYASPIDDFFSYQPFDRRAIEPLSFSDYSLYISKNYSLQHSHLPVYGW